VIILNTRRILANDQPVAGRSRTSADAQRRLVTLQELLGDQLRRLRTELGIEREAAGQ
jgi:hypothetical protein